MKKLAIKFVLVLSLAATLLPTTSGCGVGSTKEENDRTIKRVVDSDARMMTDDLGLFILARRPFYGSRYPLR